MVVWRQQKEAAENFKIFLLSNLKLYISRKVNHYPLQRFVRSTIEMAMCSIHNSSFLILNS